ncbi:MAG: gliding motility-associated C-terminal domain-containing protein [Bacteroidales bacterium]|nr:gliding motility-associated C-terminal domain-containing protein [Bacteroidales bacterium]
MKLNTDMNLKDYREAPDAGLFEKIERRLAVRRAWKVAGVVAAVAAISGVGVWYLAADRPESVSQLATTVVDDSPINLPAGKSPVAEETSTIALVPSATMEESLPDPNSLVMAAEEETKPISVQEVPIAAGLETPPSPRDVPLENSGVAEAEVEKAGNQSAQTESVPKSKANQPSGSQAHYDNILWAPNAIAPLSDDERNREFGVVATSEITHFQMFIFNRGGRQVFVTNDINQKWDATFEGRPLPQGTYVWVAKFRDTEGNLRQEKGTVTVIR